MAAVEFEASRLHLAFYLFSFFFFVSSAIRFARFLASSLLSALAGDVPY